MTTRRCYCKTPLPYTPERAYWSRIRAALFGLLAVFILAITVADEFVTALVCLPAFAPRLRRIWLAIADEYRLGAMGAVDADVIDDDTEEGV